ncbi:TPA: SDR family oxidoreductase, partial [Klebsiella pneumoniae]|nr:SDR family oxidoreductase [Klebsiella pneumoniae]
MYKYSDLVNKKVLITGASGDIGLAICEKFLEQKCTVYALYKSNVEPLIALKGNHANGNLLNILPCDLTSQKEVTALCER